MRLSAAVTALVRSVAGPGEVTQWVETAIVEKLAREAAQGEVDELRRRVDAIERYLGLADAPQNELRPR